MATVSVIIGYRGGGGTPVMKSRWSQQEARTSSAASVQSTILAEPNTYWEIGCATAVWAVFGTNPVATVGGGFLIPAGVPRTFEAVSGEKVAVIDA